VGLPLSALILAVMAIPLSFVNSRARRSYSLVVALLLFFIYNNLLSLSQAWVGQEKLGFIPGLLSIHVLMLTASAILFYRRIRVSPGASWLKK
jgi:lipopolysaccharide export system permease protein